MKGVIKITDRNRLRTGFAPLYALVIIGIIIGSMYAERGHHSENMLVHQFFMPLYGGNTLFAVMKNTFFSVAAVLIAAFIGGLSAVGQPLGAALLIYRGFGIGLSAAMMYDLFGAKAVSGVLVLILPKAVAVIIISVLAVRELFRSSGAIFAFIVRGDTHDDSRRSFRLYCIKFAALTVISLLISIADAALNYFFRASLINS